MARKPSFSPTRIRTYLSCAFMYRLEYIDKLGRFYHRSRAGYAFGSTLHQTLQRFHDAGGAAVLSPGDLVNVLDANWQSQGYADIGEEQEHHEDAVRILAAYHAATGGLADITRTFLTEKMLKWDMAEFVLTGRIDRIDEHVGDGSLEIVDYKSGRSIVTEKDVRDSLAMSIYQLLAKRNWPDRPVFATIHALRTGMSASASFSDDEMLALEDEILGIGADILERDFEAVLPIPLPTVCPSCDFLPLCTKQWIRERRDFEAELSAAG